MLSQVFHNLAAFFKPEPMIVTTNTQANKTVKCNSVNVMFPLLISAGICSSLGCLFLCRSGQSTRSPPHPQNGPRYHDRRLNGVTSLFQGRSVRPKRAPVRECLWNAGKKANLSMNRIQMPNQTRPHSTHNSTQADQLWREMIHMTLSILTNTHRTCSVPKLSEQPT